MVKKKIRTFIVLVLGICVLIACQMISHKYIGIVYSDVNTWSENTKFWGRILYDQIELTNKISKKKNIIQLPFVTDQFVLG